jgi:hypothetical protein
MYFLQIVAFGVLGRSVNSFFLKKILFRWTVYELVLSQVSKNDVMLFGAEMEFSSDGIGGVWFGISILKKKMIKWKKKKKKKK